MYNFNAHTLNGVAVSYSSLPNFALEFVERDTRLTLASKMIYIRLLRYAAMLKDTAFKITGSWLSDNLAMNRNTVSRSLVQLKQCGYVTDKGIVIPETEKAKTIENEQEKTHEEVSAIVKDLLKKVGSSKAKTDKNPVQNDAPNAAKCSIDEKSMHKNDAHDAQKTIIECSKNVHPIKNKEKNKEKNNGCEPESYPLDLPVPENQAMALAGSAGEVLQGDGMGFDSSDNTTTATTVQADTREHRKGNLITVTDSDLSSDAVVVINATSANQLGGASHA
jgi:hypothetical protein